MITIVKSTPFFIKKKDIWFADKPKLSGFFNTFYWTPSYNKALFGFKRVSHYTKLIDLSKYDDESLLSSFVKNTGYEVRKAERDGVLFGFETSYDFYISFYNSFARGKGLREIGQEMKDYNNNLLITKAVYEDEIVVIHSYLYDNLVKRASLFHTASLFREEHDSKKRRIISRANRFLHYKDMLYFLHQGYKAYDFGGYAYETKDPERININEFKDSFHGELVCETSYYPIWKYLYDGVKAIAKK